MSEVNVPGVCTSFPKAPEAEIERPQLLSAVDAIVSRRGDIVTVRGGIGSGKTTLLAQFARWKSRRSISLFVRASSPLTWDIDIVRDELLRQVRAARGVLGSEALEASPQELRRAKHRLLRQARRDSKPFYFIVDGLEEIAEKNPEAVRAIIASLEIGVEGFRFLFSGDDRVLRDFISRSAPPISPFELPPFGRDEARRYLADVTPDDDILGRLYDVSGGHPGYLAAVKRMLLKGDNVEDLLVSAPDEIHSIIELEWTRNTENLDSEALQALALIAWAQAPLQKEELVEVLAPQSPRDLLRRLSRLSFLRFDSDGGLDFVSEAFRTHARQELIDQRDRVIDVLTEQLLKDPTSLSALRMLPRYFSEAGRHDDLLQFLSDDRIAALVSQSGSTVPAEEQIRSALVSATELERDSDRARFALHLSVLRSLGGLDIWDSEVEARAALGEWEAAYSLARAATLAEDRLMLLSLIARKRREGGFEPTDDQLTELRRAVSELPEGLDRERAAEIASVLVHVLPEEAVKLVRTARTDSEDESDVSWTFALLAINAAVQTDSIEEETLDKIKLHIKDPTVRSIPERASLLLGARPAQEFIQEIEKIPHVPDRIFLIQQWLSLNRTAEDASEIVEYTLTTSVTASAFDLNASVLARVSEPLPHIEDVERLRTIIGLIDSVATRVRSRGPTEEYVRVQLRVAESEWRFNPEAAKDRLLAVALNDVADIEDSAVCLTAGALLLAALKRLDKAYGLNDDDLVDFVQKMYEDSRQVSLAETADHLGVAKGAVRALAVDCLEEAQSLASALNTATRRSLALFEIVRLWSREDESDIPWRQLIDLAKSIEVDSSRDVAITMLARLLAAEDSDVTRAALFDLDRALTTITDSVERSKAACFLMIASSKAPTDVSTLQSNLEQVIETSWLSIDNVWERVDVAFKIAQLIATDHPQLSRAYLERAESIRQQDWLHGGATAAAYMAVVRLLIRVYAGLVRSGVNQEGDYEIMQKAIDRIPSAGERAILWAEAALRCADVSEQQAKSYVVEHVEPLLDDLPSEDRSNRGRVIADVSPALYLAHKETTTDLLGTLLPEYRDQAVRNIIEWVTNRKAPSDPYEYVFGSSEQASYEELRRVVDVLRSCEEDSQLFFNVVALVDAAAPLRGQPVLTQTQRDRIGDHLESIIREAFPDSRNISHEGYAVAAEAHVGRLRAERSGEFWQGLVDRANDIENTSDRAYVLGFIALNMNATKFHLKRVELMRSAEEEVLKIPSRYDAVGRFESLAEVTYPFDNQLTRKLLKAGMEAALGADERGRIDPRALLDVAHKVDPDFAASLSQMFDEEESEPRANARLARRMELLRVSQRLLQEPQSLDASKILPATLSAAAWRSLGSLVARRVPPKPVKEAGEALRLAAGLHLENSYPLYAWYLENLVRRPPETGHGTQYLQPAYRAVALSAELLAKVAGDGREQYAGIGQKVDADSLLVQAGDRESGIRFLTDWLRAVDGTGRIKICDPYFGPSDLDLIRLIREIDPGCEIQILTSRKHQQQLKLNEPWEEAYRTAWMAISDVSPGIVDVTVVGVGAGGQLPIHDRWLLYGPKGLRLGTSFNSLGKTRESEISVMSPEETHDREREVDRYLNRDRRTHRGESLRYTLFSL